MVDRAVKSLNQLASSRAIFTETPSSSLPLTGVQRWVMDDVSRRVEAVGPCPDDLTEDLAVKELGKGAITCMIRRPTTTTLPSLILTKSRS